MLLESVKAQSAKLAGGGLGVAVTGNKKVQPNDELIATLKAAVPKFFDTAGNFKTDKFVDELQAYNIAESKGATN